MGVTVLPSLISGRFQADPSEMKGMALQALNLQAQERARKVAEAQRAQALEQQAQQAGFQRQAEEVRLKLALGAAQRAAEQDERKVKEAKTLEGMKEQYKLLAGAVSPMLAELEKNPTAEGLEKLMDAPDLAEIAVLEEALKRGEIGGRVQKVREQVWGREKEQRAVSEAADVEGRKAMREEEEVERKGKLEREKADTAEYEKRLEAVREEKKAKRKDALDQARDDQSFAIELSRGVGNFAEITAKVKAARGFNNQTLEAMLTAAYSPTTEWEEGEDKELVQAILLRERDRRIARGEWESE